MLQISASRLCASVRFFTNKTTLNSQAEIYLERLTGSDQVIVYSVELVTSKKVNGKL